MTEKLEIYKCKICGNIVQVLHEGVGEIVCCGENMTLLKPNSQENVITEYHIPVYIFKSEGEVDIQVGKEPHPMTEEHHIEFIETISKDKKTVKLQYLSGDSEPKIAVSEVSDGERAIELCNLHGVWEGKLDVKQ